MAFTMKRITQFTLYIAAIGQRDLYSSKHMSQSTGLNSTCEIYVSTLILNVPQAIASSQYTDQRGTKASPPCGPTRAAFSTCRRVYLDNHGDGKKPSRVKAA
uniref:Uncharacterized protein n=1 Tax=Timema poppense TaxID=170557 RepID=A0A7R9HH28_TIMPO|nr:unnamed protein product [Timema poppensis]